MRKASDFHVGRFLCHPRTNAYIRYAEAWVLYEIQLADRGENLFSTKYSSRKSGVDTESSPPPFTLSRYRASSSANFAFLLISSFLHLVFPRTKRFTFPCNSTFFFSTKIIKKSLFI
ncbi:hypothetical protein [Azospirillum palustre]